MVKIIVRDDGAERLAAGHAELILVKFLEERALVPGRAFEFLDGLAQVLIGYVKDADFEGLVRLGVVDEMVESAPRAFEGPEFLVVKDEIDLLGELFINLGDDGFNRLDRVVRDEGRSTQRLCGEGLDGGL